MEERPPEKPEPTVVEEAVQTFEKKWGRPPTEDELTALTLAAMQNDKSRRAALWEQGRRRPGEIRDKKEDDN